MTRINPILIVVALSCLSPGVNAQSPGGVSTNLSLWMKAGSAVANTSGTLTQWKDEKNVNTFTITGSPKVVTNVINFHPVVRFTGTQKLVGNTNIDWSECTTVASYNGAAASERGTVISPTTSGTAVNDASRYFFRSGVDNGGGYLFSGMGVDSIGFEYLTAPPDDTFNIYTASGVGNVFNRNGLDARIGELYGGFTARATRYTAKPQLGDRSTNDAKLIGDIAEIVLYGQNNATARNKVESYLALKYGITLGTPANPISYVASDGATFWTANTTYQNNIFGVGADVGSGLVQSSSNSMNTGSGDGTGQSAKGNLVLTVTTTPAGGQFLMIGADQGSLAEQQITAANGPAVAVSSWRLNRTWKAQNTGSVGAVTLSFALSGLTLKGGATSTNYFLMIDNDGNGNFANGAQTFYQASSIVSSQVVFSNITLSNNVVFTIITKPQSTIPLALDWEYFTVRAQQNTVLLEWKVGLPIARYMIDRSADGISFLQTGSTEVVGPPDAAIHTYRESAGSGTWYYRIRAIDRDGRSMISPVRSVLITATGSTLLRLRSNPVMNGSVQLELVGQGDIRLSQQYTVRVRIMDRQGRILFRQQYALSPGNNLVTIDAGTYPAGLYFIQAQTDEENKTLPFLK